MRYAHFSSFHSFTASPPRAAYHILLFILLYVLHTTFTRSESTLTCFHANHRGAHCMATGFRHNKTNPPISHDRQLTRPRLPDYCRSLEEEIEEKRKLGRKEDRRERSGCDSQGVLYRFSVQSSLSLVSFRPKLSPKTTRSSYEKKKQILVFLY